MYGKICSIFSEFHIGRQHQTWLRLWDLGAQKNPFLEHTSTKGKPGNQTWDKISKVIHSSHWANWVNYLKKQQLLSLNFKKYQVAYIRWNSCWPFKWIDVLYYYVCIVLIIAIGAGKKHIFQGFRWALTLPNFKRCSLHCQVFHERVILLLLHYVILF